MSRSTGSCRIGEVDAAVAVRAQEKGERRYEVRKKEERKKEADNKKEKTFAKLS